jgi:serine/threonine-protein kinase
VDFPKLGGAGEAAVLFDPAGRLIGLRATPPDSVRAPAGAGPSWSVLWSAAGLDSAAFVPMPLPRSVPATCDSAAAWSGSLPWNQGEKVTVVMGASHGRLAYFSMLHDWGSTTAPLDSLSAEVSSPQEWIPFLFFALLPLAGSVYFGARNLQLGRGDTRGATRIAVFVFLMNWGEAIFATHLAEVGVLGVGWDLLVGRAFGHSLIHAVGMWFAYVALEPYVRRLWPRMLVSWTRLVSGRGRDPLVGRDLLIGGTAGALLTAAGVLVEAVSARFGLTRVPTRLNSDMLSSVTSLGNTGVHLSYAGSICVLNVLESLVVLLLFRLLFRRTDLAVALTMLVLVLVSGLESAPTTGWPLALLGAVLVAIPVLVLMRFGLLAAVVTAWVGLVMSSTVASFDLSTWYADRALLPIALLGALLAYGALTALAGKSILGDPLKAAAKG